MQIEIVDGEAGWARVEALEREVYPPEVMGRVPWRDVSWEHADLRVLVSDGGGVVCHAGLYFREGANGERTVRIAGVGGVMTSPTVRRHGYASAAMAATAHIMDERGTEFGLLFCEPHNERFYGSIGWSKFAGAVFCEQPSGRVRFDMMATMILPVRTAPSPDVIDLRGLPW